MWACLKIVRVHHIPCKLQENCRNTFFSGTSPQILECKWNRERSFPWKRFIYHLMSPLFWDIPTGSLLQLRTAQFCCIQNRWSKHMKFLHPRVAKINEEHSQDIPRESLTWNLKIGLPKRRLIFQPSFFRGYIKLRGSTLLWKTSFLPSRSMMLVVSGMPYHRRFSNIAGEPMFSKTKLKSQVYSSL